MTGKPLRNDPVWEESLDWVMRLHAAPGDAALIAARDAWLAEDPAHASAYRRAERVWQMTGDLTPGTALPPAVPRRSVGRRTSWTKAALVAACLLLAALPLLRPDLLSAHLAEHSTGRAEVRMVDLHDGSRLHLDALSAASTNYADGRRAVTLHHGQAFFDVVPDAARPFTVTAGDISVVVLGTSFSVRVDEDEAAVAVRTGAVAVQPRPGGETVRLTPGERLVVDQGGHRAVRQTVAPAAVAAWREGRLIAEAATIGDVVAALRPHYKGVIVLRDPDLAGRRVTGVFDLSDPAAALEAAVRTHAGAVTHWPFVLIVGRS